MEIRGVFFDLYGTLLIIDDMSTARSDWLSAFYECLKEYGLSIPNELFSLQCDDFFERPEPPSQDDGLTVFERRIQAFCIDLGLDLSSREIQEIGVACVKTWQRHISLDPDVLHVLQTLRPKKTLALISNYDHPPFIHSLLSKLGLARFFDSVVISGDVGVKKPDPYIFSLALRQTELRPNEVVYVGDTSDDVEGSRAAGLFPILIQRNRPDENQVGLDFRLNQQSSQSKSKIPAIIDDTKTISKLLELIEMFQ